MALAKGGKCGQVKVGAKTIVDLACGEDTTQSVEKAFQSGACDRRGYLGEDDHVGKEEGREETDRN